MPKYMRMPLCEYEKTEYIMSDVDNLYFKYRICRMYNLF